MDWTQIAVTAVTVLLSSGIIQFFVGRADKKKEDEKKNESEEVKKELKKHLADTNAKWKETYCDKNAKAIEDLIKEVHLGLDEREAKGKERYEEHRKAIEKLTEDHQEAIKAMQEAIEQLKKNDDKITDSLEVIADKQGIMADASVGMIHNTLIRFTDPIIARGKVSYSELATLDSLYLPYSKLGGNGECKRRYEDVNKLEKIRNEDVS